MFRTQEGRAETIIEAYGGAANNPNEAEGSRGAVLHPGVGDPGSFTLTAEWDSVDAHTALTQKPQFESFGEAVVPYLAGQPGVRHVEAVG